MERREFLKAGAAGAAMAATGCATGKAKTHPATAPAPSPSDRHVEHLTTGIDRVLAGINSTDLVREIVPADLPLPHNDREAMSPVESILDKGLRSLYVSGIFLDQPESLRARPELQKRVIDNLPVMDETIRESTALLAGLTQEDGREFQKVLNQHPDMGMRIAEAIDQRAGDIGISHKRRMQLRLAATQITARLRHQAPAVVAEEYLVKTNKAYVRHGESELARKLAAQAGQQMFWAPVVAAEGAGSEKIFRPSGPISSAAPQATSTSKTTSISPAPNESSPPVAPRKSSDKALSAAGWMFGIGAAFFLGGLVVVEMGAFPGVFAMTVGVLLFLIAIVTGIVGIILKTAKR